MRGYDEIKAEIERLKKELEPMMEIGQLYAAKNARMWALKWVLREE